MSFILAGAPYSAAQTETLITSFTLTNTNGAGTTEVLWRGGMPFVDGDVPSGSSIVIRRNSDDSEVDAYQFDRRVSYSSGALKHALCHMRDETDLGAGASRTYDIYAKSASSFDNTAWDTHANILSDITTNSDFTGTFSSHSQPNQSDTTNHAYSLNTALGTADQITIHHMGDVCFGGKVTEIKNGEILGEWFFDIWKDKSASTTGNIECGLKLSLPLWDVANKDRHDYTLTFAEDVTTLDTYSTLQHCYHAGWVTLRTDSDAEAGKRHWQTAANMPTLLYKPTKSYWVSTGLIPPYDTTVTPSDSFDETGTYSAFGTYSHRTGNLDAGGSYNGRGPLPKQDAVAFLKQTAGATRGARLNAMVGIHIGLTFRSNDNRNRSSFTDGGYNDFSGESAAKGYTPIALNVEPQVSYDFTGDGLPAAKHAYRAGSGSDLGGYTTYTGGDGSWTSVPGKTDSSHATNYVQYMYMLEGEPYLYDTMLDHAMTTLHRTAAGNDSGRPRQIGYGNTTRRSLWSLDAQQYDGVVCGTVANSRANGWGLTCQAAGWGLCSDNDQCRNFFDLLITQTGEYLSDCLAKIPTAYKTRGIIWERNNGTSIEAPYFLAFCTVGVAHFVGLTGNSDVLSALDVAVKYQTERWNSGSYNMRAYRAANANQVSSADNESDLFATGTTFASLNSGGGAQIITASTDIVSEGGSGTLHPFQGAFVDTDDLYAFTKTGENASATIPAELSAQTVYNVYNSSGDTIQVTTDGGSSAIDFASDQSDLSLCISVSDADKALNQDDGFIDVITDATFMHAFCALHMARQVGSSSVSTALLSEIDTFLNGGSFAGVPQWAMNATV